MVLVIKVGGRALTSNMREIVKDLASLAEEERLILVHGGGDVVTDYSRRMGIEPKIMVSASGVRFRYTDEEELEVFVMVMAGKLNKEIVSALNALGAQAVGVSGVDGSLLLAERKRRVIIIDERGRKRVIPGGYTGKVVSVNKHLIRTLIGAGYVVVVAPIAMDQHGTMLNIDADQAASAIASALSADALIMLSDVEGVIVDGEVIKRIGSEEILSLARSVGKGMNRKLIMAGEALKSGVRRVVIASGLVKRPVTNALNGGGTVIGDA